MFKKSKKKQRKIKTDLWDIPVIDLKSLWGDIPVIDFKFDIPVIDWNFDHKISKKRKKRTTKKSRLSL